MPNTIVNYDGSIKMTPQQIVRPRTVEEIQDVLRDLARFPSPVRAMGSCHSLTPCAATDGTIIDMKGMNRVIDINETSKTFTAQAGLQIVEASDALRERDLQFMTNIEIGNMTLGSAACCHTKDALDGIEFGQVGSYVTRIKWVTPTGELAEASESSDPQLLRKFRTSYGLAGVVYEVTFRVKPLEAIHFTYLPRPVEELTHAEVDDLLRRPGVLDRRSDRGVPAAGAHRGAAPSQLAVRRRATAALESHRCSRRTLHRSVHCR